MTPKQPELACSLLQYVHSLIVNLWTLICKLAVVICMDELSQGRKGDQGNAIFITQPHVYLSLLVGFDTKVRVRVGLASEPTRDAWPYTRARVR